MQLKLYLKTVIYFMLSIGYLDANELLETSNCLSSTKYEEIGCSIANILETPSQTFRIREEEPIKEIIQEKFELNITERLSFIKVKHQKEEIFIKREAKSKKHTCPPFCIQPIKIKNIHSIGELDVLAFIKTLKEKKSKLLIDVRSATRYKISTIPGAINIPYSMMEDKSKYQEKVLKLLGATEQKSQWKFTRVPTLLIFGNSEEEPQATKAIKSLLKLSYPSNKILYYRGGLEAWKRLGLTLY
jgi:rhodanese-related sulfurtransferase